MAEQWHRDDAFHVDETVEGDDPVVAESMDDDGTDEVTAAPLPAVSAPAQRALAASGITGLGELSLHTEKDVASLHGVGPNTLKKLSAALSQHGLGFRPESSDQDASG
ncbi:hypothetical protein GCM10027416_13390 [Okibacterium endophyticum]